MIHMWIMGGDVDGSSAHRIHDRLRDEAGRDLIGAGPRVSRAAAADPDAGHHRLEGD
jgi:hypothetical protein